MSEYLRTVDQIVFDYAAWLKSKNIEINPESIYSDSSLKNDLLSTLIEKCYSKRDGFWYFTTFIIGPDVLSGKKIWNPLVSDFWDIITKYRKIAILCPRGHGKSYFFSILYPLYLMFLFKKVEILDMANITKQAKINLKKIKDMISDNELLDNRKDKNANWNQEEIEYNKSELYVKSLGGVTRGIHANYVSGDDILRDDQTYSDSYIIAYVGESVVPIAQRKKGTVVLVGTPQSSEDIFHKYMQDENGNLITDGRISTKGFYSKVYRAVKNFDTQEVLLPDVLSFDDLMEIRKTQGELAFEKEYQCNCISDKTAIFPESLLRENFLSRTAQWENEAIPGAHYVIAADVATSGAASADYSAFIVLRIDKENDNKKFIVHIVHKKGSEVSEQIDILHDLSKKFNNAFVLVEKNNVGVALIQELVKRNVNVEPFVTDKPKKDGAIRYLQNEISRARIRCPWDFNLHPETKKLYEELLSFGLKVKRGKERMEALSGHDDLVDALWLANLAAQDKTSGPSFVIIQD